MAVIGGRTPEPREPSDYPRRVVVKFRPEMRLTFSPAAEAEHAQARRDDWDALQARYPGVRLRPYFGTVAPATLQSLEAAAPSGTTDRPLTSYFGIDVPAGADAAALAETVARWGHVEIAYLEGGPTPPPVSPENDPLSGNQGYLNAAPDGIDARWAWSLADGSKVGFVDMERGWTLNHEDLSAASIAIISGLNQDYPGHGTAVLGEAVGVDNTIGVVGIAPKATARVVGQWRSSTTYNTAEAILSAASAMSAGDVLLLEAQTTYPGVATFLPVEVEQAVFDAIVTTVAKGIIVVEAAANGSNDLDNFQDVLGKKILNRTSSDFRDSGAIMVGAASSAVPHTRLGFSNFGSRIDCYGWGENIQTTGDGWMGTSTTAYTPTFGGTSGASPIVTGAALLLQSWAACNGIGVFTPAKVRTLLSDPALNTASANPAGDRIGVMPDLYAILQQQTSLMMASATGTRRSSWAAARSS